MSIVTHFPKISKKVTLEKKQCGRPELEKMYKNHTDFILGWFSKIVIM